MMNRLSLLRRKTGLENADFAARWRDADGTLAARLPGLRGYLRHRVTDPGPRGDWNIDGICELQFANADTMRAALGSQAFAAMTAAAAQFRDPASIVVCEKHEAIPCTADDLPAVKRMSILRRRPEVSPEEFRREWLGRHAELVRTWPKLLGYTQNLVIARYDEHTREASHDDIPVDGVVELWFRSKEDAAEVVTTAAFARTKEHTETIVASVAPYFVETTRIA
ncbi:EthD family reductase [Phreatobacter stygius]|uniref:EthD family reductase n=1 Tax=Phreatobacter stygius TaxID=1940610 RepID=A0A4D7B7P4_9HYPH|nr:EthD family reductase [Phreatobacter stygius]QCI64162.1 EthD family reductase [Phreatobacter stygius]